MYHRISTIVREALSQSFLEDELKTAYGLGDEFKISYILTLWDHGLWYSMNEYNVSAAVRVAMIGFGMSLTNMWRI